MAFEYPEVIYLHDGDTEVTWSEYKELGGVKYIKAQALAFESWAKAAGFHDFDTNENGCYEDDFLQHCYLGWCAGRSE